MLVFIFLVAGACAPSTGPSGGGPPGSGVDAGTSADLAMPSGPDASGILFEISVRGAVRDALWINPEMFAQMPLEIAVAGGMPSSVSVVIEGAVTMAEDPDGDGTYRAAVPVSALGDGLYTMTVHADDTAHDVSIGVGRAGKRWTDVTMVGGAASTRLHRAGSAMYLTWTDARETNKQAWMQELDGAGEAVGTPVRLSSPSENIATIYTAMSTDAVAVLYLAADMPSGMAAWLAIYDLLGGVRMAPMRIDPAGYGTAYGAEIVYSSGAFYATWRSRKKPPAPFDTKLWWMRVDVTTPVPTPSAATLVAVSGTGDPVGEFAVLMPNSIAVQNGVSAIGFTRDVYDPFLQLGVPKAQVAIVDASGALVTTRVLGVPGDHQWEDQAFVYPHGNGELVGIWTRRAADPSSAIWLRAQRMDTQGASIASVRDVASGPSTRYQPRVIARPSSTAALVWEDHAPYFPDPSVGYIALAYTTVDEALTTMPKLMVPHARLQGDMSRPGGVSVDKNVILAWTDKRRAGVAAPVAFEAYLETLWLE